MSVPRPGADPNANLYHQLKRDVLERVPEIADVEFVPNRAEARRLRATFAPARLDVGTGPESPTLVLEWYRQTPEDWFRVDYSDPNTGLHAGWHQDEDHPDLGPAHRQVSAGDEIERRPAAFDHETPSLVLWEIVEALLETVLPAYYH